MSFEKPAVVLDNGSYNMKAGFSCDNHPVSIFRTVVGRPNYLNGSYGKKHYDVLIGDEAIAKTDDLELCSPIAKGRIVHWDNMERIWHHCFYKELKVAPEDRAVILACSSITPMEEKIKCCEVFFETLNTPELCVQPQSVLALYGSGYTTGISVDLGYDSADINPAYEGGLIKYAHMQTNVHGFLLANFIKQKLVDRHLDIGLRIDDIIEDIKQNMNIHKGFVCKKEDYHKKYTLPSGDTIDISEDSNMAAEMLFQPNFVSGNKTEFLSLPEAIVTSALKCDSELQSDLYDAIIPWGGLATISGLNERLQFEIQELTHKPANVVTSMEPYTVAWLGGATFAGLTEAKKIWVSKKQYEDHGEKIVRNKFL